MTFTRFVWVKRYLINEGQLLFPSLSLSLSLSSPLRFLGSMKYITDENQLTPKLIKRKYG
jgi:hypothetical protein